MLDKKLDIGKSIIEYIPIIKEYFIKFYGEEYRDLIENRFQNTTYIGYSRPKDIEILLIEVAKLETLNLIKDFLKENNIEVSDENIKKYFGINPDFRYSSINKLEGLFRYLFNDNLSLYEKNDLNNKLKDISGIDNLVMESALYQKWVDKIVKMKPSYDAMIIKFKENYSKYDKYVKYVEECNILKRKIHDKYQNKYLREIYEFMSEHDKEILNNESSKIKISELDCYEVLCGFNYSNKSLIDSFSNESNERINNQDTPSFILNNIYKDRISFFKKNGIDLGDNYESYKNDKRCVDIIPSVDFIKKIIEIRDNLNEMEQEEYLSSTSLYKEQLREIDDLNLLDKAHGYNFKNIDSHLTCISPNVRVIDGNYQLYNLLLYSTYRSSGCFDQHLIHEFNHLVETELLNVGANSYEVRCGWEVLGGEFEETLKNESVLDIPKRKFEYLNEIINEFLAQEVTKSLHDDGIFLLDDKENSKISNTTSYESYGFLIRKFYDGFKDDIIQSRMSGNIYKFYEKIGEDNLLELNQLVHDFAERFSGFKYYDLCDKLRDKVMDEDVEFYNECIRKSNMIFNNMQEVHLEYLNGHNYQK